MGFADEKVIKSNGDENPPEQGTTPQQVRSRRIRVVQARVRARRGQKAKYGLN